MNTHSNLKSRLISALLLTMATVPAAMGQSVNISSGSGGNFSVGSMSGGTVIVNGVIVSGSSGSIVGSGPEKAEVRKVGLFTGLRLEAPANVSYTVGGPPLLTVSAQANILPLVTAVVEKGLLVISIKGSVTLSEPIKVVASGPNLNDLRSMGTGTIGLRGASGSEMRVKVSGSGAVAVSGLVGRLVANVNGSGDLDASALKSNVVEATVSGSGGVKAYASKEARTDVSGSGSIQILGQPAQRHIEKSGSGQVAFR